MREAAEMSPSQVLDDVVKSGVGACEPSLVGHWQVQASRNVGFVDTAFTRLTTLSGHSDCSRSRDKTARGYQLEFLDTYA